MPFRWDEIDGAFASMRCHFLFNIAPNPATNTSIKIHMTALQKKSNSAIFGII